MRKLACAFIIGALFLPGKAFAIDCETINPGAHRARLSVGFPVLMAATKKRLIVFPIWRLLETVWVSRRVEGNIGGVSLKTWWLAAVALLIFGCGPGMARSCGDVTPGARPGPNVPEGKYNDAYTLPYSDSCFVQWPGSNAGQPSPEEFERRCHNLSNVRFLEFDGDHGSNFNLCVFQIVDKDGGNGGSDVDTGNLIDRLRRQSNNSGNANGLDEQKRQQEEPTLPAVNPFRQAGDANTAVAANPFRVPATPSPSDYLGTMTAEQCRVIGGVPDSTISSAADPDPPRPCHRYDPTLAAHLKRPPSNLPEGLCPDHIHYVSPSGTCPAD
jgi:hypothetical protein